MSSGPVASDGTSGDDHEVGVRVLRGHPDAAETAALVAVLLARAAARPPAVAPVRAVPLWAAPRARLRSPVAAGPGRWRASAGPVGQ